MSSTEPCFMTAAELVQSIQARKLSCKEVMEAHVVQIERVNPQVNAIVTFVPEQALQQAGQADEALARGEKTGPLHGLPVAHKDLADTKGPPHYVWFPDLQRSRPRRKRSPRHAHPAGRRNHRRQDQHGRVRSRLAYLQFGLRHNPQPLGYNQDQRRQQRRRGCRARLRHGAAGRRKRFGGLAAQPGQFFVTSWVSVRRRDGSPTGPP